MARTISRFGRDYVEYDPSGGNGPSTWILTSAGSGSSGGSSTLPSGIWTPSVPGTSLSAGQALYLSRQDELDHAIAGDALLPVTVQPYQVIGLAAANAIDGQKVSIITDGQLQLADWTPVTGAMDLRPGHTYYLSATTPGALQDQPPSGAGVTIVEIGRAVSERTLEIEINVQVRLS